MTATITQRDPLVDTALRVMDVLDRIEVTAAADERTSHRNGVSLRNRISAGRNARASRETARQIRLALGVPQ